MYHHEYVDEDGHVTRWYSVVPTADDLERMMQGETEEGKQERIRRLRGQVKDNTDYVYEKIVNEEIMRDFEKFLQGVEPFDISGKD